MLGQTDHLPQHLLLYFSIIKRMYFVSKAFSGSHYRKKCHKIIVQISQRCPAPPKCRCTDSRIHDHPNDQKSFCSPGDQTKKAIDLLSLSTNLSIKVVSRCFQLPSDNCRILDAPPNCATHHSASAVHLKKDPVIAGSGIRLHLPDRIRHIPQRISRNGIRQGIDTSPQAPVSCGRFFRLICHKFFLPAHRLYHIYLSLFSDIPEYKDWLPIQI